MSGNLPAEANDSLQPTFISVDEELIRKALDVCETAIENTAEVLANHDASLGRTTRKNKWIADRHEAEITAAKSCRDLLRVASTERLGCAVRRD